MYFDLVSDLHVDLQRMQWHKAIKQIDWAAVKNPTSRVLVIAGDTTNRSKKTITVLREVAPHYEHVVFVDGNHEHYDNSQSAGKLNVPNDMEYLAEQAATMPNVTYLNGRSEFVLDRTLFIGACGWYDFQFGSPEFTPEVQKIAWKAESSDPKYIRWNKVGGSTTVEDFAREHAELLSNQVAAAQDRDEIDEIVVVTHTIPNRGGVHYWLGNRTWNALNGAYGNFQMSLVVANDAKKKIKVWCFGHTHIPHDFYDAGIHYLCRPRGYHNRNDVGQEWVRPAQVQTDVPAPEPENESAFGPVER